MKFEYKRPEDMTLEAYGKVFEIPPKTALLVDGINAVNAEITSAVSAAEQAKAIKRGIGLFIGSAAAEEIYPEAKLDNINIDEMSAFWLTLNEMSNRETALVVEKYAGKPKNEIRVTSNPKK